MSFDAKIFRILIASPGDVQVERDLIPEIINDWNTINAESTKVVLLPVKWETHSTPLLGDRPQAILNTQIVKDCDLLVGVFWTRIGTKTGVAESGTVEEIEQFVQSGKPVMLYFSQSPISPDKIDVDQLSSIKSFKANMKLEGLTQTYESIHDFRQLFTRQLSTNVANIITTTLQEDVSSLQPINNTKKTEAKNKDSQKSVIKLPTISPVNVSEDLNSEKINFYLIQAVQSTANESGWARIAAVGAYLQTFTPVNYKTQGHSKFQAFLKSRNLFEFEVENQHPILKLLPNISKDINMVKEPSE